MRIAGFVLAVVAVTGTAALGCQPGWIKTGSRSVLGGREYEVCDAECEWPPKKTGDFMNTGCQHYYRSIYRDIRPGEKLVPVCRLNKLNAGPYKGETKALCEVRSAVGNACRMPGDTSVHQDHDCAPGLVCSNRTCIVEDPRWEFKLTHFVSVDFNKKIEDNPQCRETPHEYVSAYESKKAIRGIICDESLTLEEMCCALSLYRSEAVNTCLQWAGAYSYALLSRLDLLRNDWRCTHGYGGQYRPPYQLLKVREDAFGNSIVKKGADGAPLPRKGPDGKPQTDAKGRALPEYEKDRVTLTEKNLDDQWGELAGCRRMDFLMEHFAADPGKYLARDPKTGWRYEEKYADADMQNIRENIKLLVRARQQYRALEEVPPDAPAPKLGDLDYWENRLLELRSYLKGYKSVDSRDALQMERRLDRVNAVLEFVKKKIWEKKHRADREAYREARRLLVAYWRARKADPWEKDAITYSYVRGKDDVEESIRFLDEVTRKKEFDKFVAPKAGSFYSFPWVADLNLGKGSRYSAAEARLMYFSSGRKRLAEPHFDPATGKSVVFGKDPLPQGMYNRKTDKVEFGPDEVERILQDLPQYVELKIGFNERSKVPEARLFPTEEMVEVVLRQWLAIATGLYSADGTPMNYRGWTANNPFPLDSQQFFTAYENFVLMYGNTDPIEAYKRNRLLPWETKVTWGQVYWNMAGKAVNLGLNLMPLVLPGGVFARIAMVGMNYALEAGISQVKRYLSLTPVVEEWLDTFVTAALLGGGWAHGKLFCHKQLPAGAKAALAERRAFPFPERAVWEGKGPIPGGEHCKVISSTERPLFSSPVHAPSETGLAMGAAGADLGFAKGGEAAAAGVQPVLKQPCDRLIPCRSNVTGAKRADCDLGTAIVMHQAARNQRVAVPHQMAKVLAGASDAQHTFAVLPVYIEKNGAKVVDPTRALFVDGAFRSGSGDILMTTIARDSPAGILSETDAGRRFLREVSARGYAEIDQMTLDEVRRAFAGRRGADGGVHVPDGVARPTIAELIDPARATAFDLYGAGPKARYTPDKVESIVRGSASCGPAAAALASDVPIAATVRADVAPLATPRPLAATDQAFVYSRYQRGSDRINWASRIESRARAGEASGEVLTETRKLYDYNQHTHKVLAFDRNPATGEILVVDRIGYEMLADSFQEAVREGARLDALIRANGTAAPAELWRIEIRPDGLPTPRVGETFVKPEIASTAKARGAAEGYYKDKVANEPALASREKVTVRIEVPSGTRGLDMNEALRDFKPAEGYVHQQEVLLPGGTRYRLKSRVSEAGGTVEVWELLGPAETRAPPVLVEKAPVGIGDVAGQGAGGAISLSADCGPLGCPGRAIRNRSLADTTIPVDLEWKHLTQAEKDRIMGTLKSSLRANDTALPARAFLINRNAQVESASIVATDNAVRFQFKKDVVFVTGHGNPGSKVHIRVGTDFYYHQNQSVMEEIWVNLEQHELNLLLTEIGESPAFIGRNRSFLSVCCSGAEGGAGELALGHQLAFKAPVGAEVIAPTGYLLHEYDPTRGLVRLAVFAKEGDAVPVRFEDAFVKYVRQADGSVAKFTVKRNEIRALFQPEMGVNYAKEELQAAQRLTVIPWDWSSHITGSFRGAEGARSPATNIRFTEMAQRSLAETRPSIRRKSWEWLIDCQDGRQSLPKFPENGNWHELEGRALKEGDREWVFQARRNPDGSTDVRIFEGSKAEIGVWRSHNKQQSLGLPLDLERPPLSKLAHHDPKSPEFRGGGAGMTTPAPPSANRLYDQSIPGPDGLTFWARDEQGNFHRFMPTDKKAGGVGMHWNGATGAPGGGLPIRQDDVPGEIREFFRLQDDIARLTKTMKKTAESGASVPGAES